MNYYELLEITENASDEVIKAAYKAQVAKYHPDNIKSGSLEKMQEINMAFETLSDPVRRKEYDRRIKDNKSFAEKNQEEQDKQTEEKTQHIWKEQEITDTGREEKRLKWFLSLPAIFLAMYFFSIAGVILFILRCIILHSNKEIYKRKKKIRNTWITVAASIALILIALMLPDSESNTSQSVSTNAQTENMQSGTEIAEIESETSLSSSSKEKTENVQDDTETQIASDEQSEEPNKGVSKENHSKETRDIQKIEVVYDADSLNRSKQEYSYYENPYYLDGLQRYIDFMNEKYINQQVSQISLEQVLKEADVSATMRKRILDSEGKNVLEDKSFYKVEYKKDGKILFSKGKYYEVSSYAKDDVDSDSGEVYFYLGDLKDNKPHGEGALFSGTFTGLRLEYAGDFEDGRFSGKGVSMICQHYGAQLRYVGDYKDGKEDGTGILYNTDNIENIYNPILTEVDENLTRMQDAEFSEEIINEVISNVIRTDGCAELYLASILYSEFSLEEFTVDEYIVRVNYPIIKPIISYQGDLKKEQYHGKGILYGGMGMLWYEGSFKYDEFNGNGTLYYADTGIPEYEGEFKNGNYHGQGKIYNEDGSIRKDGKFSKEKPNEDDETKKCENIGSLYSEDLVANIEKIFETGYDKGYETDYGEYDLGNDYDDEENYAEYVLPYSSESYYSEEDLEGLSADECRIARNEIYARHGRIFDDPELQNYFESLSWYEPSVSGNSFSDSVLNEAERYNLDLIIQYEETMGYR